MASQLNSNISEGHSVELGQCKKPELFISSINLLYMHFIHNQAKLYFMLHLHFCPKFNTTIEQKFQKFLIKSYKCRNSIVTSKAVWNLCMNGLYHSFQNPRIMSLTTIRAKKSNQLKSMKSYWIPPTSICCFERLLVGKHFLIIG